VEQIEIASSGLSRPFGKRRASARLPTRHAEACATRGANTRVCRVETLLDAWHALNTRRVVGWLLDLNKSLGQPTSGAGTARSNVTFTRRRLRRALEQAAVAWLHVLLLAWIAVALCHPALADEAPPLDYQVKAAFLLNFTKFVEWPGTAFTDAHSPLAICILGEDPFGNALDDMVKGEAVHGRELIIRRIRRAPESKACQVLFVASSGKDAAKIFAESGPGVLTVGEGGKFLQDGGIIAFVIENRRVRFDIGQRAAMKAMLTLSSRLLMVARTVEQ
jgi:hypothetical protein